MLQGHRGSSCQVGPIMVRKTLPFLGAFVVLSIGYLAGFFFFGHLFADEAPANPPLLPFFPAFAISNVLLVIFFAWVAREMEHTMNAALSVAIGQILLVNVFYVMTGSRTVIAGAASSLVLLVTWPLVAITFQALQDRAKVATVQE